MAFSPFQLVVVDQIYFIGVTVHKAENNPPIGPHRHRPETLPVALKRVKMKAGHPHVLDSPSFVELVEDGTNLVQEIGPNPTRIIPFEEPLKALMPKANYHTVV
jgi:hypothetical protein